MLKGATASKATLISSDSSRDGDLLHDMSKESGKILTTALYDGELFSYNRRTALCRNMVRRVVKSVAMVQHPCLKSHRSFQEDQHQLQLVLRI